MKLNRQKLEGKYYDTIVDSITKVFSALYPNNKVVIKYQTARNMYYFGVYINGSTIDKGGMHLAIDKLVYVDGFTNEEAVKMFTAIPMVEYEKTFDAYKEENYDFLKEEVKKLKEEYEAKGVIFEHCKVDKHGYRFEFYHLQNSKQYDYTPTYLSCCTGIENPKHKRTSVYGGFNITPITINTAKTTISKLRSRLKKLMEKPTA